MEIVWYILQTSSQLTFVFSVSQGWCLLVSGPHPLCDIHKLVRVHTDHQLFASLGLIYLGQWFSARGDFAPRGVFGNV